MDFYTATEAAFNNGYNKAKKELEDCVILSNEEYVGLMKIANPAPWCKSDMCEGISEKCKHTCPDSIYTEIRENAIKDCLVKYCNFSADDAKAIAQQYMTETYGITYQPDNICCVCGAKLPNKKAKICRTCFEKLGRAIQNS